MTILVLLRRLRAHPDGTPADAVVGRCDDAALATALALRGDGRVVVLSAGPEREEEALRYALARGADRAARIWGPGLAGVDYHGVARALAAAARRLEYDLILSGDVSEDEGQGAVGPAVAEVLEVPHVTSAVDVKLSSPDVLVTRRDRGCIRTLKVPLPAVLTVRSSAAVLPEPREPSAVVEVLDLDTLGIEARELRHRDRCVGRVSPVRLHGNPTVVAEPAELVARLKAERLLW